MPQASAASSMAASSAADPEARPGARMGPGVPMSLRTASWLTAMAGLA